MFVYVFHFVCSISSALQSRAVLGVLKNEMKAMSSWRQHHASVLRAVAERLRLEPVAQIARQPGIQAVYRITLLYAGLRALPAVATVRQSPLDGARLWLQFEGALTKHPLTYRLPPVRWDAFTRALQAAGFDRLRDQPDLPAVDVADVWLVERAAGAFAHNILLAPASAQAGYADIVAAVRGYLPEALREIAP